MRSEHNKLDLNACKQKSKTLLEHFWLICNPFDELNSNMILQKKIHRLNSNPGTSFAMIF